MALKDIIKKVEKNKSFKSFIKANPDYYLAHCFSMIDEGKKDKEEKAKGKGTGAKKQAVKWELGYYSDKADKLVVFEISPKVVMRDAENALKRDGSINKLDMAKVKVSLTKALDICSELMSKNYPGRSVTKNIIVLQNLDGQMYNITLVTLSFDIINIKIDSETGEVISHNLQSIMSLGKWEKGEKAGDSGGKPAAA